MPMGSNAVVLLPCLLEGIHVHHSHLEVAKLVEEPVVDLPGDIMPLRH